MLREIKCSANPDAGGGFSHLIGLMLPLVGPDSSKGRAFSQHEALAHRGP